MIVERNLIISLLELTKEGPVSHQLINKHAKISSGMSRKLLKKLQDERLVYVRRTTVEADSLSRLKLAIRAITLGADIERVSGLLHWREFEDIAAVALERNDYKVKKNLRFKHAGRKWEIDIVGCKKPIAVCVDCKHWHRKMRPSALKNIANAQAERTRALGELLPDPSCKIECSSWDEIKLVPTILLLIPGGSKFYDDVPVVPVLQLQDFIGQLPGHINSLKHFTRKLEHLSHDL
jgi:Holliday junction resolvase-like predicted endonuclease